MYPPTETNAETATVDSVFSALATESRRLVLAYFDASSTQTASLDDLTEYVATRQSVGDATRERVKTRLHHSGLPKLAAAGLITYDAQTTTVRYSEERAVTEFAALVRERTE